MTEFLAPMTQAEIDALVRGYSNERLRENYARAAKHPGTEWHRILLAEMGRRSLTAGDPPEHVVRAAKNLHKGEQS